MLEYTLEKLKPLTRAVDFISEENAKELVDFISRRIIKEMSACTVDLLWKEPAQKGTYLKVFWTDTKSGRGPAKGRFVNQQSNGIWSKVYRERKPIWIEGIQSKKYEKSINNGGKDSTLEEGQIRLTEPVENKRGGDIIDSSDLVFYEDIDTIIAIPLSYRDTIWGIYSIELERYHKTVEEKTFKDIERLAKEMAIAIWKSDVEKQNVKDTSEAIKNFKDSIEIDPETTKLNPIRMGLIVRPFVGKEFEYVEKYLNECLHTKGVHLEHYSHPPGAGIVIDNLMKQIKQAHFGIADITENRPNSLLELGMMMILGKQLLILKRKDDDTDVPFDIGAYQYYKYEMQGPALMFFEPGKEEPLRIDNILDLFIKRLENDKSFSRAKPYTT